jgi:hypothetical protein
MKAMLMEEVGKPMVVKDWPEPKCPAHGAILRVEASGICRSDWHLWQGDWGWRSSGGPARPGIAITRPSFGRHLRIVRRPSAVLSQSTSKSSRLTIASNSKCAPTSCCACSATMSSGKCARRSCRYCSMTTIPPRLRPPGFRWLRQPSVPAQRKASPNLPQMKTPLHNFHALLSERAPVPKNRLLPKTEDSMPFATALPLPPVVATRFRSARCELSHVVSKAYPFCLIS